MEMEVEEDKGGMKKCPMCREEFSSIVQLPDPVENPKEVCYFPPFCFPFLIIFILHNTNNATITVVSTR